MSVTYEPWLVLLSVVIAIQGAYVGLGLAVQVGSAASVRRRLLLAGAALSLAVAIWAMHFVGMLAVRLPFPVDYLVFPTLVSFLVCVIVVGAAVYAVSSGPLTPLRLTLAACLMGGGIFSMHYIGMTALDACAHMTHASFYVAASLAVAVAASGLALWLATGRGGNSPLILPATAFGIAISGMHYTAMQGLILVPYGAMASGAPVLSTDLLAIVVAIVAFCVSGLFLLILVPEHARAALGVASPYASAASASIQAIIAQANSGEASSEPFVRPRDKIDPPRDFARQLPFERDGATHFVDVADIVAVRANAHYTYIFDGADKLFCPLAIGDVEARLDANQFVRVHRSHIVNIDRVIGHKRSGDSDLLEMDARDYYAVPVSRSRFVGLRSRINAKLAHA